MKIHAIFSAGVLALGITTISAVPTPNPEAAAAAAVIPSAEHFWLHHFCHKEGQPCAKLKRAAAAAANAMAEATATAVVPTADHFWLHHSCHKEGQPCAKAKRSAEALAEAAANAYAAAQPAPEPKLGRESMFREFHKFCRVAGQPCAKVKRVADDIDVALNDNSPHTDVGYSENSEEFKKAAAQCYAPDGPCTKAALAAEELKKATRGAFSSL